MRDSASVKIGARALDILIILAARAGAVVETRTLMKLVWPGITIEEVTFRSQIKALRAALADGTDGERYILNVSGRGYSLAVTIRSDAAGGADRIPHHSEVSRNLPPPMANMIGRSHTVDALSSLLLERRLVSIVAPGGMGKTTVVIALAHHLRQQFGDGDIYFVDLASLTDPRELIGTLAEAAGCPPEPGNPEQALMTHLSQKRSLVVLDSCEHVIDAAAQLSSRILELTSLTHLLITSREALRIDGECVHLLRPLECALDESLPLALALEIPAIALFVSRASASGYSKPLDEEDAPLISRLCRRLDGIPLAIELAASRVGAYGLQGLVDLLDWGAELGMQGRRNALPRHQTLKAMLGWSFRLLTGHEQELFVQLSVIVGAFSVEDAENVARIEGAAVREVLLSLADKSLLSVSLSGNTAIFRLLDTTRAYAAGALIESGLAAAAASRHAAYFTALLPSPGVPVAQDLPNRRSTYPHFGNTRAALTWCFSNEGDTVLGVTLVARSAPLFIEQSLFGECRYWCQRALGVLSMDNSDQAVQLDLLESFAVCSLSLWGSGEDILSAIERALQIAKDCNEIARQMRLLVTLHIFHLRVGALEAARAVADQLGALARDSSHSKMAAIAEWSHANAFHFDGDQAKAMEHYRHGFEIDVAIPDEPTLVVNVDHRLQARVGQARTLWLQGFPQQACSIANYLVTHLGESKATPSCCYAALNTVPVFIWSGQLARAEHLIESAVAKAETESVGFCQTVAQALKGEIMIARRDVAHGVDMIERAFQTARAKGFHSLKAGMLLPLAVGLLQCGQSDKALVAVEQAVERSNQASGATFSSEIHRMHGEILLAQRQPNLIAGEESLVRSLSVARQQAAVSWELRSATSLARLWTGLGRREEAIALLREVYDRFTEGFETPDLVAGRQLYEEISRPHRHA